MNHSDDPGETYGHSDHDTSAAIRILRRLGVLRKHPAPGSFWFKAMDAPLFYVAVLGVLVSVVLLVVTSVLGMLW